MVEHSRRCTTCAQHVLTSPPDVDGTGAIQKMDNAWWQIVSPAQLDIFVVLAQGALVRIALALAGDLRRFASSKVTGGTPEIIIRIISTLAALMLAQETLQSWCCHGRFNACSSMGSQFQLHDAELREQPLTLCKTLCTCTCSQQKCWQPLNNQHT